MNKHRYTQTCVCMHKVRLSQSEVPAEPSSLLLLALDSDFCSMEQVQVLMHCTWTFSGWCWLIAGYHTIFSSCINSLAGERTLSHSGKHRTL